MTPIMPTSVSTLTRMPSSAELMKSWIDFDVARDPRDQVAGARLVVFGERQPLDVVVERPAQVVPHPLADAGGQVLLEVGADGADDRDAPPRRPRRSSAMAYGPSPKSPVTTPPSQPGSGFDCRMLSTTILMGHGSRRSVSVSPSTATSASVSAFQCGRTRSMILVVRVDGESRRGVSGSGMSVSECTQRAGVQLCTMRQPLYTFPHDSHDRGASDARHSLVPRRLLEFRAAGVPGADGRRMSSRRSAARRSR